LLTADIMFSWKKRNQILATFILVLMILVIFRNYFFKGQIPFPANFLVSFFQPWISQELSGAPSKPIGVDNLRIFYPQRTFTNQMVKRGQIPFWNPYNFSGNVHLANSQTAVFYPLFSLFFLLPPIFVWSLMIIIQPILIAFFTYLFLKLITKDFFASLYGAIVFAFCGWMIVRWQDGLVIGHAALWLPFILFSLEKYLLTKQKKWMLLSIFGLLSSLLAGWFQVTFYVWLISFLYAFFREKRILVFPFLLALFLGSFHIVPAIEALFLSPRGLSQAKDFSDRFLMPMNHLITFLAPDFFGNTGAHNFFNKGFYQESMLYIGLAPLALALWALISLWKKEKAVCFFGLLGLITLPLGFDLPISHWFLNLPLPILSSFLPSRIFFINSFCFSILSAFGFSLLRKSKKGFLIIILIIFFYALLKGAQYSQLQGSYQSRIMGRNLILPFFIFLSFTGLVFISRFLKKNWLILGIFILTIFPQLYFANKYLYFSEKQFIFPSHPVLQFLQQEADINRFWSWGKSHILPNLATYYQIYSPEGVDAMYPLWYGELIEAVDKQGEIRKNVPRIEAQIKQVGDAAIDWEDKFRYQFLSLTGVKYIVGLKNERFLPPEHSFNKVWENDQWAAWEYKKALPRSFWVPNFVEEKDKQKRADLIFNPEFPLDKKVVLSEIITGDWDFKEEGEGKVEVLSYQPNKVILQVEADQDGLVFLSDVYYPGWCVTIDGQQTKIYQANYAFRAVPVPSGKHKVIFSFFPDSFKKGLHISLISLGGLVFWISHSKIKKKDDS